MRPAFRDGAVRSNLMESFQNEYTSRKAQFLKGSGSHVKRRIHGVEREGQVLEYTLGGQRMKTEVYAFQKGKRVVALILQHDVSEADLAKKHFSIITESLE